jgi:hypothetical protein
LYRDPSRQVDALPNIWEAISGGSSPSSNVSVDLAGNFYSNSNHVGLITPDDGCIFFALLAAKL